MRSAHPHVDVGTGYVVLRKEASYLDAHCRLCGAKMDRKINEHLAADNPNASVKVLEQGRPWGLQLLFLESCHASNDPVEHKKMVRSWLIGVGMRWAQRSALRVHYSADPAFAQIVDAERPRRSPDEPAEPYGLVGFWYLMYQKALFVFIQ